MLSVDFIFSNGCPNVAATRAHLIEAFARAGQAARWLEWDLDDPSTPAEFRIHGSPTVLVNGRDVAPASALTHGNRGACRIYQDGDRHTGVPPVALLINAFGSTPSPVLLSIGDRRPWHGLAFLPAAGIAAVPVGLCPVCYAAYISVFSALGLTFLLDPRVLTPLAVLALALALLALGWKARTRHGYGPLAAGAIGAACLGLGQLVMLRPMLVWAGVALLGGAAVWNAWPRRQAPRCSACPQP